MMITTHLRNLLTAVICIFAGATAQAQLSGTLDLPVSDSKFDSMPVEFSLSGVASALETDAATLAGALDAWEMGTNDMFFLADPEDATVLYNDYTQGGKGGFWVLNTGIPAGWGTEGLTWYNTIGWDVDEDLFVISIGQYPGVSEVGDVYKPHFVLKYNGKEVGFDVTINFVENTDPVYEIPEPATLIEKDLNIVGNAEVTVEQYPRTGYDSDNVKLELTDLAEKLGVEPELIAASMDKLLYATEYNSGDVEDGGGLKKDSLTNKFSAGEPGFWLRAVQNEQGEETGECSRAGYSSDDKFYVEAFAFDAETATLSCDLGQYPGSLKGGEKWYANIYLLYADKAYRVRYNLNLLEREQGSGTEGMNKVGEDVINCELSPDPSEYSFVPIHPDVDGIATALGCEVGAMSMQALDDTENWASPTAGNQGFWFNSAGTVTAWGSSSYFYIENPTSMDYSTLNVGQYPGRLSIGEEYNTKLYFINGDNYYELSVFLKMVEPKVIDNEFKEVARRSLNFQQVPDINYTWTDGIEFGRDFVNETLGTTDWVVYGKALLDENGNEPEGNAKYVKNYTCTPYPGFWMNADGRNCGWNDDAIFGITVGGRASGEMAMIQYPNRCSIGNVLKTQIYLVNEETSEMVTYNITYSIVSEIVNYEEVGAEDVKIPISMAEDCSIDFDLSPAAEALGVSVDDLTAESNRYLKGMMGGTYSEGVNIETGLGFNANGDCDAQGDYYFYFEDGKMYTGTNVDIPEDFSLPIQFAFNIDDKLYVYYATLVSTEIYTGIKNVGSDVKADNRIFDISGRQVTKPTRGLYIQNGKKVVIK